MSIINVLLVFLFTMASLASTLGAYQLGKLKPDGPWYAAYALVFAAACMIIAMVIVADSFAYVPPPF
jgi:ABC-type proline/glycine betaine transport system permease subunit